MTPAKLASTKNIPKGIVGTAPSLVGEAVANTEPVDVFDGPAVAEDFVPLVIVALAAEGVKEAFVQIARYSLSTLE